MSLWRLVRRERTWSDKWSLVRFIVRSWLQTPAQRRQIRGILRRAPMTFPVHFDETGVVAMPTLSLTWTDRRHLVADAIAAHLIASHHPRYAEFNIDTKMDRIVADAFFQADAYLQAVDRMLQRDSRQQTEAAT